MSNLALVITNVIEDSYDTTKENSELLHLQADIEPDGSSAQLSIHTTEGHLDLSITVEQMSATIAEMREAGSVMMSRQLKTRDKGRSAFEAMVRSAPMAATVTPTICRKTGDVIIVYRFPDRMPFVVRVTQDQISCALNDISSELKRSAN